VFVFMYNQGVGRKGKKMKRLQKVICKALTTSDSSLHYHRILIAIEKIANRISISLEEVEWNNKEEGISLYSLIVGAYWYCDQYHDGQKSQEYKCLCALRKVFKPGYSWFEEKSESGIIFRALEAIN